jgi:large repetitive protein
MKKNLFFALLLTFGAFATSFAQAVNDTVYVTINRLPVKVNPIASRDSVYAGQSVNLTVTNCIGTVNWNNGLTGGSVTINPTTTRYYVAQCTSSAGCVGAKDSVRVVFKSLISPIATSASICFNESTTLTAPSTCTGGTITWSNNSTGGSITVSPTSTTTYTYTCTYTGSGTSNASGNLTVQVKPRPLAPTLVANPASILTGASSTITASNCSGTISWTKPDGTPITTSVSGGSLTITPTATTTYLAYCTTNGCSGPSASQEITVDSPIPSVAFSAPQICQGDPITITASGCNGTYVWSSGQTTPAITVTTTLSNYTVNVLCRTTAGDSAPKKIKLKLN